MLNPLEAVVGSLLPISALIVACGGARSGDASSNRYEPQTLSEAGVKSSYAATARVAYVDSLETARALQQVTDTLIVNPGESNLYPRRPRTHHPGSHHLARWRSRSS